MATPSNILTWRIPWTEETGGPQSMGLQRVVKPVQDFPPFKVQPGFHLYLLPSLITHSFLGLLFPGFSKEALISTPAREDTF